MDHNASLSWSLDRVTETDDNGLQKLRVTFGSAALGMAQSWEGIKANKISSARADVVTGKFEACIITKMKL